ncbi:MAG: hypothetical protein V5A55_14775 [Halovenus sp.]
MARPSQETENGQRLTSVTSLFPAGNPGESVLVYGPTMSGKRTLGFELLAATEASDMRVYVTTNERASKGRAALATATSPAVSETTTVIDCLAAEDSEGTIAVESPGDLLGISAAVSTVYDGARRRDRVGSRLLIDDVSTLLLHAGIDAVTRFLHPVIGKVEDSGGLLVATLGTDGLDPATRRAILGLFESRIEVRNHGEHGPACRLDSEDTWYQFDPLLEDPQ